MASSAESSSEPEDEPTTPRSMITRLEQREQRLQQELQEVQKELQEVQNRLLELRLQQEQPRQICEPCPGWQYDERTGVYAQITD